MVKSCSAFNCTQRYKKGSGISFFSFPSDSKLRSLWILAMKRENFEATCHTTICSKHFLESDLIKQFGQIRLREGSIPSIFDFPKHMKKETKPRKIRKSSEEDIQEKSTSQAKKLKLDLPSTSSENYLNRVNIDTPDSSEKPPIQRKARKSYFGDIKYSSLKSSEAKMVWNIAYRTIEKMKKDYNKLRTGRYKLKSKVTKMRELITYLKRSKNVSQNCYDIMQECIPKAEQELVLRQLKVSSNKEYPEQLRSFALTLNFYSTSAYNYVRSMFSNCLPHPKTLSKWYKTVDGSPGYTTESLRAIELKSREMKREGKTLICNLVMDEMSIRKHIQWNGKKQVGYINYGYPMESETLPEAKEVLVFLIVAINSRWKLPIAYFLINGLGAEEKANMVNGCLSMLHQVGVQISSITFDGAATNLSMASILGAKLYDINNIQSYFAHPITKELVYVILDACHMVKLIRNLLGDWGILYDKDGNAINWNFIKNLVTLQENYGLHAATKIKSRHINYSQEKMKVKLAVQTLSDSVADALLYCSDDLKLKQFQGAHGTAVFCRVVNNIFDAMNTRNSLGKGTFKRPLSRSNKDFFFSYFEYAKDYFINLKDDKGEQVVTSRRKIGLLGLLINMSSIQGIVKDQILENQNLHYLLTYKLSQDHLEMFFSNIRSRGGFNNNPTAVQFEAAYKKLLIHVELKTSEAANCLAQDTTSILRVSSSAMRENNELDELNQEDESEGDEFEYLTLDQYESDVVAYISNSTKFLGVHVDSELKWDVHIQYLNKRLNSTIYAINVLKKSVNLSTLKIIYFAGFQSNLSYGIVCWGNSPFSESLFVKQKYAIRSIMNMKYRQSCRGVFRANNIHTLTGLYVYDCLKFLIQHQDIFEPYRNKNVRTRQVDCYLYPTHKLTLTQHNAMYMCMKLFNALPKKFRSIKTEKILLSKVNSFILECEPYSTQEYFDYCKAEKTINF